MWGRTEPISTPDGVLTRREDIDAYLLQGEMNGRVWLYDRTKQLPTRYTPTDADIRDLHRGMFGNLLP